MHFCGLQSLCLLNRVRWKKKYSKQVADPLLGAPPKYQGKFSKVREKPNVMVNLKMSWKNSWKVAEYECEPCVSCCVTGLHLIKDKGLDVRISWWYVKKPVGSKLDRYCLSSDCNCRIRGHSELFQ